PRGSTASSATTTASTAAATPTTAATSRPCNPPRPDRGPPPGGPQRLGLRTTPAPHTTAELDPGRDPLIAALGRLSDFRARTDAQQGRRWLLSREPIRPVEVALRVPDGTMRNVPGPVAHRVGMGYGFREPQPCVIDFLGSGPQCPCLK